VSFATHAQAADFAAMLRDGRWPEVDLSTTVLLERAPEQSARAQGAPAPATLRIVRYGLTEIAVEVEAAAAGYLVLNDPYQPWWFAEVDGKEAPILKANVLFRAVRVSAGRHDVRFTFRPFLGAWRQVGR
jgi:hypothetical protein